ncbi:MAG: LPS-assembly protein LptD, partial [Deltaproteobacteria bacterium]|nr:LPS-assembly protein LptD [Deltaproteobacteria bacterium]
PIFYSPYFSWPTKQGRSSGILIPIFSSVDSADATKSYGARLQIPYFIALDRDHDVTITSDIIQRRGLGVDIDYLYAFKPGMSGQFRTWFIKETQQERDLEIEPLGSLNPGSGGTDLNPLRYRYLYDHRQKFFLNGQFFFHQHENGDAEINKEYFAAEVTKETHFSRTFNLVFPWGSPNWSVSYETGDDFIYGSIYDKTTDKETHLNRHPSVSFSQRFSSLIGTPLSISLAGTGTNYDRIYGWNSLFTQSSIQLTAPFNLDFLNVWPRFQRDFYNFDSYYQARSGEAPQGSKKYGWSIDRRDLELNLEVYRYFYNYENVADSKLSIRPRVIYREIQDVDQTEGGGAEFIDTVLSQKTLTYKLDISYLVKDLGTKEVRSLFGMNLTQIYNLQMEEDQTFLNQPGNLETEQGEPRLPLRISFSFSPVSLFSASLFYRYDHNISRIVETGIGLSTGSADGSSFSLGYTNNEKAYVEPDATNHPVANIYSIGHTLRLSDRWTLSMGGTWDQNRSNLSYRYTEIPDIKRLDRQMTDLTAAVFYRHNCYNFSAAYQEGIESALLQGVTTEFLEKKFILTLQFQVLPTSSSVSSFPVAPAANDIASPVSGVQYQQGFLLPN